MPFRPAGPSPCTYLCRAPADGYYGRRNSPSWQASWRAEALSEQRPAPPSAVPSIGGMGADTAGGTARATYDEHADWYNEFMSAAGPGEYIRRVHGALEDLLGPGAGRCLDVCCGTGAHAPVLAGLGW